MKPSTELFQLIKSLDKSEKRQVKLLSGLYSGDKIHLKLFEAIDEQKQYDEEKLKRKFQNTKFINRFSAVKGYLYDFILKALIYKDLESYEHLSTSYKVSILVKKGLKSQALHYLDKIEKRAEKKEDFETLLSVSKWKRQYSIDFKSLKKAHEYWAEQQDRYNRYLSSESRMSNLTFLYKKVIALAEVKGNVHSETDLFDIEDIEKEIAKYESAIASLKERDAVLMIKTTFYYLIRDLKRYYALSEELVEFLLKNSSKQMFREAHIILSLSNHIFACLRTGKWDKHKHYLKLLNDYPVNTIQHKDLKNRTYYSSKLNFMLYTGQFKEADDLMPEVESWLESQKNKLPVNDQVIFQYMFAFVLYGNGDLERALDYLFPILNENAFKAIDHFYTSTRILNIIIHFELNHLEHLEYLISSSKVYLKNKQRVFESERKLFNFLSKAVKQQPSHNDWKAFRDEISETLKHPFEHSAQEYFDLLSWANARVNETSYAEERNKIYQA